MNHKLINQMFTAYLLKLRK